MANLGAKKRLEENRKRLKYLQIAMAVGIATNALIRLMLRRGYASTAHIVGFGALLFLDLFSYSAIAKFAEPEYNEKGDIVYAGADLSMGGMCAYWHDLLYISVFVQVASSLSAYFWYTLLVVPGFALYMLYKNVLRPYWEASRAAPPPMDEATRKRLERTQQRAERRRMKWR